MPKCCKCGKEFPYNKMFCPLLNSLANKDCFNHKSILVCIDCADKTNMTTTKTFMISVPVTTLGKDKETIKKLFSIFVEILQETIDKRIENF